MADLNPLIIASQPGCKRDGTLLEGENYVDTQWCRFQLRKGLPRKMGGYRSLTTQLSGISRGLNVFNSGLTAYTHTGWSGGLERFKIDQDGVISSVTNRTPVGFTADDNNLWQFDNLSVLTGLDSYLLAHAAPNLTDITANEDRPVYYGIVTDADALVATTSPNVSGGVMALGPFAVSYGNNGVVNYTSVDAPNTVTGIWESVRPTASKLVYGLPVRAGAGNGPSGLIWGVDSLIRMTFVGGDATFNFDNITSAYSLLSSQCIIEYDGIYYWAGIDHFLSFNGVIQEVENGMNLNWFYDNLNYAQSQKVFAFKIPRWGEIWWCYPRGEATECTHAVIYNVRLSRLFGYAVWYDTELPNGGRSTGQFARVFRSPLMTGVVADATTNGYKLWQQEYGVDDVDGSNTSAIQSYFETNSIWPAEGQNGNNRGLYVDYFEPDFVQSGDMTVQVTGSYSNARAPDVYSDPISFPATATSAEDQVVYIREQRRQMRFKFESNVSGGNYEMGETVAQVRPADGRITS